MKYIVILTSTLISVLGFALFSGEREKPSSEKSLPYIIKPEQLKPEGTLEMPKERVEPSRETPELFTNHNAAFLRAKELRKHFVIWINEFDHEIYMELPEAVHVKVTSHAGLTQGAFVYCLKQDGQFYELIDLSKDNSVQIQRVPLNRFNLPFIKEFLKNPK